MLVPHNYSVIMRGRGRKIEIIEQQPDIHSSAHRMD